MRLLPFVINIRLEEDLEQASECAGSYNEPCYHPQSCSQSRTNQRTLYPIETLPGKVAEEHTAQEELKKAQDRKGRSDISYRWDLQAEF